MLSHFLVFVLLVCGFPISSLQANLLQDEQEEEIRLQVPEQFSVKQRWFSWTNSFDIEHAAGKMGILHRRFLSLTLEYDFYDVNEQLQANARMRIFSIGATFDVTDAMGNLIGTTDQKIFRFFPTFEILSVEKHTLAVAKMNFWGTKYTLSDPSTHENFVEMSRPFIRFRDSWNVKVTNPSLFAQKNIDPRLFIVVMAYQTDMDFWAYQARQARNRGIMTIEPLMEESSNHAKWAGLRQDLELYDTLLEKEEPSEADFLHIENFVEAYLAESINLASKEEWRQSQEPIYQKNLEEMFQDYALYQEDKFYDGIRFLIPLFEDDRLTAAHKKALFLMIDAQLKQWEE
jgi:uncharacterized protein YxjI